MFEQAIERLTHADPNVRYDAAQTLGASKDPRAVEPLIGVLPDSNAKVQYAAFSGLVKLADSRAAAPIITTLLEQRDSRLWELLNLNIGLRLRMGLLNMVERGDAGIADRLIEALRSGQLDQAQEAFVLRLLGRTADERVLEPMIDSLINGSPMIQGAAAEALGWMGDARAVEPLLGFVEADTGQMREIVTEALGRIGDGRAYEALLAALKDGDEWVRRSAAEALGRLGDKRALPPLAGLMTDPDPMVQDAAFEAIKQLSDEHYTTIL